MGTQGGVVRGIWDISFLAVYLQDLFSSLLHFEERTVAEQMWQVNLYVGQS